MYSDDSFLESYYEDRNDALYFEPPYIPYEDEEYDYEEPELERCEADISGDEVCFGHILSDGYCSRIREHI